MRKNKNYHRRANPFKRRRGIDGKAVNERLGYEDLRNNRYEEYYKHQHIMTDSEWDAFLLTMRTPLPTSFRVNNTCVTAQTVIQDISKLSKQIYDSRDEIKEAILIENEKQKKENEKQKSSNDTISTSTLDSDYQKDSKITEVVKEITNQSTNKINSSIIDSENENSLQPLSWYPGNLAWTCSTSKKALKHISCLKEFRDFLIEKTLQGTITRQEVVSMIPPLFLDIKSNHLVLDACAAPGSKTAQLLETLHFEKQFPDGLIVANDSDPKRAKLLVHQIKRLGLGGYMITMHRAQHLPKLLYKDGSNIRFDRILCDVPCSGDGTLRKNIDLWRSWSPYNGTSMHYLQIMIAKRGIVCLKLDGLMCYSTCSLNPIENEAVVTQVLLSFQNEIELVDCSNLLPGLKRYPGLSSWEFQCPKTLKWFTTFDSYKESVNGDVGHIRSSMFPPEDSAKLKLNRCVRILPHHQNTGGFFVALFRRYADRSKTSSSNDPISEIDHNITSSHTIKSIDNEEKKDKDEQPCNNCEELTITKNNSIPDIDDYEGPIFSLYSTNINILNSISEFWGFKDFPIHNLFCRSTKIRRIYLLTRYASQVLENPKNARLNLIATGSKLFERANESGSGCSYRICQEGLSSVFPFLTKQIIHTSFKEWFMLLSRSTVSIEEFVSAEGIKDCVLGSVVVVARDFPDSLKCIKEPLLLCAWKSNRSLILMVPKPNRKSLLALSKSI